MAAGPKGPLLVVAVKLVGPNPAGQQTNLASCPLTSDAEKIQIPCMGSGGAFSASSEPSAMNRKFHLRMAPKRELAQKERELLCC